MEKEAFKKIDFYRHVTNKMYEIISRKFPELGSFDIVVERNAGATRFSVISTGKPPVSVEYAPGRIRGNVMFSMLKEKIRNILQ